MSRQSRSERRNLKRKKLTEPTFGFNRKKLQQIELSLGFEVPVHVYDVCYYIRSLNRKWREWSLETRAEVGKRAGVGEGTILSMETPTYIYNVLYHVLDVSRALGYKIHVTYAEPHDFFHTSAHITNIRIERLPHRKVYPMKLPPGDKKWKW